MGLSGGFPQNLGSTGFPSMISLLMNMRERWKGINQKYKLDLNKKFNIMATEKAMERLISKQINRFACWPQIYFSGLIIL